MNVYKPLISIIVPVYNAEGFLIECVESIMSQTFLDFELILVNDGSKDSSGIICEKYKEKDNRVRVFHKENGGVSSARNLGLNNAKGIWILFVDADDYITRNILKEIVHDLTEEFDLLLFNTNSIKDNTVLPRSRVNNHADLNSLLMSKSIKGELWNYIFKRQLILNYHISFSESIRVAEDREFVIKYISCAKNIKVLDKDVYNYREDNFSVMQSLRRLSDIYDHLKVIENVHCFYIKNRGSINEFFMNKSIIELFKITLSFIALSGYSLNELLSARKAYKKSFRKIYNTKSCKNIQINPFFFFFNILYYHNKLK